MYEDEDSILDGLPADIFDEGFQVGPSMSSKLGIDSMKTLAGDINDEHCSNGGGSLASENSKTSATSFSKPADDVLDFGIIPTTELTSKRDVGIPSKIDSLDQLVQILTTVVFTCSVDHAATGNGLYDIYCNVGNAPMALRQPPPVSNSNPISMQQVMNTLPDQDTSAAQAAVGFTLSKY